MKLANQIYKTLRPKPNSRAFTEAPERWRKNAVANKCTPEASMYELDGVYVWQQHGNENNTDEFYYFLPSNSATPIWIRYTPVAWRGMDEDFKFLLGNSYQFILEVADFTAVGDASVLLLGQDLQGNPVSLAQRLVTLGFVVLPFAGKAVRFAGKMGKAIFRDVKDAAKKIGDLRRFNPFNAPLEVAGMGKLSPEQIQELLGQIDNLEKKKGLDVLKLTPENLIVPQIGTGGGGGGKKKLRPNFANTKKATASNKDPNKTPTRPSKEDPSNPDPNIRRNAKGELNQVDETYLSNLEKRYLAAFIAKPYKIPPDVEFIRLYRSFAKAHGTEVVNAALKAFDYNILKLQITISKVQKLGADIPLLLECATYHCVANNFTELMKFIDLTGGNSNKIKSILTDIGACEGRPATFKRYVNELSYFNRTQIAPLAINPTQKPNLAGTSFDDVNIQHILDKHSLEHFDFATNDLTSPIEFFPVGTTQAQVCAWIEEALQILNHSNPNPSLPLHAQAQTVTLSNGMSVKIGSNIGSAITVGTRFPSHQSIIGQFYPIKNTGNTITIEGKKGLEVYNTYFNTQ